MSTMYVALTVLLVFVSIAMIALVLLQKGKGAEAGAAFGAGASGTVFGARGSTNFLSRSTAVLATVFFLNCLALAYLGTQRTTPESVLETMEPEADGDAGTGLIPAEGDLGDEIPAAPIDAGDGDLADELPELLDEGSGEPGAGDAAEDSPEQ